VVAVAVATAIADNFEQMRYKGAHCCALAM